MVDHFSEFNLCAPDEKHNPIGLISIKSYFEIWDSTFVIISNRYHADNGRFSVKPFISEIEDAS